MNSIRQNSEERRRSLKHKLIGASLLMSLLLCLLAFSNCAKRVAPNTADDKSGWMLENNQRARLSDYKGKVVVLDFYATWCEPCRAETPALVKMQQQYREQGLQVIGLNVGGADDRAEVPGFAKEFGIQYPLGFPDDEFADQYLKDNQNIPQAFVFDRGGKLVKRFIGYSKQSGKELERVVQASLTQAQ